MNRQLRALIYTTSKHNSNKYIPIGQCKSSHKSLIHGVVFVLHIFEYLIIFFINISVQYCIFNAIIQNVGYQNFQRSFYFLLKKQPLKGVLELQTFSVTAFVCSV